MSIGNTFYLRLKFYLSIFIFLGFAFYAPLSLAQGVNEEMKDNWVKGHPVPTSTDNKISAHRGAYRLNGTPQNSIAAYRDAVSLGLYASELDIQLTRDGKLVVNHDSDYKGLNIAHSTYKELVNAGNLSNGEKLPLFEDFVKEALKEKRTVLMVDVKARSIADGGDISSANAAIEAMKIARKYQAENFLIFLVRTDFIMQRLLPFSNGEFKVAYQNKGSAAEFAAKEYNWASQRYTNFHPDNIEGLREFKKRGIKLKVWEVDRREIMEWFIKEDVDILETNFPEMALEVTRMI